jgi:hypothetical protein
MEIAPAISSANPPYTTTLVSLSAESPAVRAKGTVKPSERPMMASEITRPLIFKAALGFGFRAQGTFFVRLTKRLLCLDIRAEARREPELGFEGVYTHVLDHRT